MIQLDFYPPKTKDNMSFPLNIEVKLSLLSNHASYMLSMYIRICTHVYMCIYIYIYIYIHRFICISIQAQYLNLHEWFPATNQATSPSNEYIQITLKTEDPKVRYLYEIWLHVEIIAS